MKNIIFSHRSFLNKKGFHSNASISTDITHSEYGEGFYGTFKISDCNRTVELSIDLDGKEDYDNTLYKMNKIIDAAEKYKKAIIKLRPSIIKYQKDQEAKKLAKKEKS